MHAKAWVEQHACPAGEAARTPRYLEQSCREGVEVGQDTSGRDFRGQNRLVLRDEGPAIFREPLFPQHPHIGKGHWCMVWK